MALNLKSPEVDRLAAELAELTGESKTEAVRRALRERRERLALGVARRRDVEEFRRFLAEEVWPALPQEVRGRGLTKPEREAILGYGPEGV